MTSPRIAFAGTPDFALASLRALVNAGIRPVAVMTQPDRPSGRGRRLTSSPVKDYALAQGLPVMQPATLKDPDAVSDLAATAPDLLVVAAYGLLLPQDVLDTPVLGCVNVHASLLPRWRGAAPIQAAILSGDEETGVCLMQMEAGLDTGPVFACASVPIDDETTAGRLHDELAELGGSLLVEQLPSILSGDLEAQSQDDALATYAGKIKPADAKIDWRLPAIELHRRIRAYDPVPGARFELGDEVVKAWRAHLGRRPDRSSVELPGQILSSTGDGIEVACGQGSVVLTELQRPGKTRVSASEFAAQLDLRGRSFA